MPPPRRIRVAVVDEDDSELSRRLVAGLTSGAESSRAHHGGRRRQGRASRSRRRREAGARRGRAGRHRSAARVGAGAAAFGQASTAPHVQLLADVSDQIAPQMVHGLLQKVAMTSAPDILMKGGISQFERYAGALTPEQRSAVDAWLPRLDAGGCRGATRASAPPANGVFGVAIDTVDVMRQGNRESPDLVLRCGHRRDVPAVLITGASGALLEEVDSGTLDRVLSTRVGMSGLLTGKWLFLTLMGVGAAHADVSLGTDRLRPRPVLITCPGSS